MKEIIDISVFATNYNNAPYLEVFMQSILQATVEPKEIIFVDDGSTDSSLYIMKQYHNLTNLKIISFDKNQGRSAALNEGKKYCTGKYTLLIDPDDIMLPNRMEMQWMYMEKHPEIDVLGGNVQYFNGKTGGNLNQSNFSEKDVLNVYKRGENGVLQPTVIIKTALYQQYEYVEMVPGQDYELFARMAKHGYRFANLPDVLNRMRVHPASAVSNMTYKSLSKIFDCRDRIFNTRTSVLKKYLYYSHLKFYRKGMLAHRIFGKFFYLALAAVCQPRKILTRLVR